MSSCPGTWMVPSQWPVGPGAPCADGRAQRARKTSEDRTPAAAWRLMTAPLGFPGATAHPSRDTAGPIASSRQNQCRIPGTASFASAAGRFNTKDEVGASADQCGGCVEGRIVASFFALPGRFVRYFSADSTT